MCAIVRQCTHVGDASMQSIVVHDCHVHVLMRRVYDLICAAATLFLGVYFKNVFCYEETKNIKHVVSQFAMNASCCRDTARCADDLECQPPPVGVSLFFLCIGPLEPVAGPERERFTCGWKLGLLLASVLQEDPSYHAK
jgi:hypothetical protein